MEGVQVQLIPVIDLMRGEVVRGIAGNRKEYQSNQSCLLHGSAPLETAAAFRTHFGIEHIYLADLDAIEGRAKPSPVINMLVDAGHQLVVDCGVTSAVDAQDLLKIGVSKIVVPLESISSLQSVSEIIQVLGPHRTIFSLDLKDGVPLGKVAANMSLETIIRNVVDFGIETMIVLDLAGVGTSSGVKTIPLCRSIQTSHRSLKIWSGGGIRSMADVAALAANGVEGVLVASALHDGRITPDDWGPLQSQHSS